LQGKAQAHRWAFMPMRLCLVYLFIWYFKRVDDLLPTFIFLEKKNTSFANPNSGHPVMVEK
jgi:hypothetical protein